MDSKADDDFWNISSSSGFNFDDEDEDTDKKSFIFTSATEESPTLPIHSIISKTGLDLILDDVKSTNLRAVTPVEETIKKMFYNLNYSLEQYKTLQEKLSLLDAAIETMDGNIIIKIILYLKSTLKLYIFHHQLAKRKIAIKHYIHYLIINNKIQELADTLMATGNSSKMNMLQYLIAKDVTNKDLLVKKLEQFLFDHLHESGDDDKKEINDHLKLLRYQTENKQTCDSVIDQLAALCKSEWSKNKNSHDKINNFKKLMNIDDFSFEWTVLNVMASLENWAPIHDFFVKPGWMTKKPNLKSVIRPELFVYCLSKHKPPKDILEQYLKYIPNTEEAIHLAHKLNCHKFVIQQYVSQKDRNALIEYKKYVNPQSEEFFFIEHGLRSIQI